MDGWKENKNMKKDGRLDGQKKQMDGWMDISKIDGWLEGRTTNLKIKQMDGWMDKHIWTNRWMVG